MEALGPLEFLGDVEVALPEVVCGWQHDDAPAEPASLLLPLVTPSPPKPDDDERSASPPARRRKFSSLFPSRRASAPAVARASEPPPILAALEAVAPSPSPDRWLEPFHFGVSTCHAQPAVAAEVPRPRGRVFSAIALPCSPLELRLPAAPDAPPPSKKGASGARSCHAAERSPDGSADRSAGSGLASGSGQSLSTSVPRLDTPRLLPPLTVRSCDAPSPRKPPSPARGQRCACCGLALAVGAMANDATALALDAAHAVHRACFHCAQCHEPLTLANFHVLPASPSGRQRFACTTHHVERLLETTKLPAA